MVAAMTIRIAHTVEHDDEIAALDAECFADGTAPPVAISADADCWVALHGQTIVGYLVGEPTAVGGYLSRYGVAGAHSGQGIGQRLVRAWLRSLSAQGVTWAWTYTHAHNAASINALVACGFKSWAPGTFPVTGEPQSEKFCLWRRAL